MYRTAVSNEPRLWLYKIAKLGLPQAGDSEANHLLGVIRIQAITRQEARKAAQDENPLGQTADSLLVIISKLQRSNPLYQRLKKELGTSTSREGYTLGQGGLLQYNKRAVVPAQKALIQELLYLYHDD